MNKAKRGCLGISMILLMFAAALVLTARPIISYIAELPWGGSEAKARPAAPAVKEGDYIWYLPPGTADFFGDVIQEGVVVENASTVFYRTRRRDAIYVSAEDKKSGRITRMLEDRVAAFMIASEDALYFTDYGEDWKLCAVDIDGQNFRVLDDRICMFPALSQEENAIYFSSYGDAEIIRFDLSTGESETAGNYAASCLTFLDGRLYFLNHLDMKISVLNEDGSAAPVSDYECERFVSYGNSFLYISDGDIRRVNIDGSEERRYMDTHSAELLCVTGHYIFFTESDGGIYRETDEWRQLEGMDYVRQASEFIDGEIWYLACADGRIYYISGEDGGLHSCDMNGNDVVPIDYWE